MKKTLILASGSKIRAQLMKNAGLDFEVVAPRIDETAIKAALLQEKAPPRDIADTLAEFKARRVGQKRPAALVLGCDQVAEVDQQVLNKPQTQQEARDQLTRLSGKTHRLMSAAVMYHENEPVWRHVGVVRLTMRKLSPAYIDGYVARNWDSIQYSVGSYKLEEEGVRLFSQVAGDYFNVLGLPLTELLSYLIIRGELEI